MGKALKPTTLLPYPPGGYCSTHPRPGPPRDAQAGEPKIQPPAGGGRVGCAREGVGNHGSTGELGIDLERGAVDALRFLEDGASHAVCG